MSRQDMEAPGAMGPPQGRGSPWILTAIGGAAMLVLLIGFAVWIGSRDEEITSSSSLSTTTSVSTSATDTATTSPTTIDNTIPPTTISATIPATTISVTTSPPTTAPALPTGDSWTIASQYFPDDPFTFDRVTQVERLSAYDGAIDFGPSGVRCVAIVIEGDDGWSEWCGDTGQAVNFVILDGIDPWLVEVGAEPGAVTLNRRDPAWTLPSNGCTVPMTTLLAAGLIEPAVVTEVVCVPGEAFLLIGSVLFQQGPADGGGTLVADGDEGWDTLDFGTSISCFDQFDGVDRCALYGVEFELFEALLPIPPNDVLTTATDIVGIRNETTTVQGWVDAATEPAAIDARIVDQLTEPGAELAPSITRASSVGYTPGHNLLIVEVPAMDDSILSTTWAIWIRNGEPATVVKAFAWETCARGLAGPDLCI